MDPSRWPSPSPERPPRLRLAPLPAAARGQAALEAPAEGATLSDPLVVIGRCPRRLRPLLAFRRRLPRLLLDGRPAAHLSSAVFDGDRFALLVALRQVLEGAHTLHLRSGSGQTFPGTGRTVFLRRRPQGVDLLAARRAWVPVRKLGGRVAAVTAWIAGRPWDCRSWLCGRNGDGWLGVAELDLTPLPPGLHPLEIRPEGHPVTSLRLLRLPG